MDCSSQPFGSSALALSTCAVPVRAAVNDGHLARFVNQEAGPDTREVQQQRLTAVREVVT